MLFLREIKFKNNLAFKYAVEVKWMSNMQKLWQQTVSVQGQRQQLYTKNYRPIEFNEATFIATFSKYHSKSSCISRGLFLTSTAP